MLTNVTQIDMLEGIATTLIIKCYINRKQLTEIDIIMKALYYQIFFLLIDIKLNFVFCFE